MSVARNERGIALVITLLVVALLTITVIEFTYSVAPSGLVKRTMVRTLLAAS